MTTELPTPTLVNWNSATADDTPTDAPGQDCPDHGPYGDDDCPKCEIGMRFTHLGFGTGTVIAITDDERLNVQVKFDSPSRFGSKFWFDMSEVQRPAVFPTCSACHTNGEPPSSVSAGLCVGCANAQHFGFSTRFAAALHAVTLQSRAIEQVMQQNRICPNCQGAHYGWQCPEILSALHAVYDTSELVQLWGSDRALLVAKLAELTRPQLLTQAIAFAAWLETRAHAGLSAASILHIWETLLCSSAAPERVAA